MVRSRTPPCIEAYNRVLLSAVLAGEVASSDIELKPQRWWRDRGITVRYGCRATAIDLKARVVTLADGKSLPFSQLVFATGSQPIRPQIVANSFLTEQVSTRRALPVY